MKFKHGTRRRAIEYEKDWVIRWKQNKTFEKSVEQRPVNNSWVFYDGPPFITGTPHAGTLFISSVKDAVARYWSMQGKRVERRWGWDCHGLPAEIFVEKQLGITKKEEIGNKISVHDYVNACRSSMIQTGSLWEDSVDRIGRWVEFEGAYKTMDNEYMESVWWAFKELYDKGKIYEGEKILVYCTKDATPISKSEVAMENSYQLDTDPSVFVYFKLENTEQYLMAWTTTPWTLPANVALAVNQDLQYSLVKYQGKEVFVASDALERVFKDEKKQPLEYEVTKTVKGQSLVGKKYHPLFENHGPNAHVILDADFVTAEDGTGIVHQAPAYGEDDYELCKKSGIPVVSMVDENGNYTSGRWQEKNIWEVNKEIAKTLVAEGAAMKIEYIQHDYPHCHRCGTKLMYRAHPSWFMDIQDQKNDMLSATKKTKWVPGNIRDGRFANIIDTAPDWNLSRDRYWATPLPVWKGQRPDGTEVIKVIGSYQELKNLTGTELDDYHLPYVMDITFVIDGVELKHIGKVIDCWFESGSMPFAQFHYPFENKQRFKSSFPADFITEAIDQTRGWFYSLTAVNVGLFGQSPFRNLICLGLVNAADGKKLSKKLKNYTDPNELMDLYGADSLRFLLLGSPLLNGENFALNDRDVLDVQRKLGMIWNMYDFFTMYAEVDGWEYKGELKDPLDECTNPLDIWVISRLHQLVSDIETGMNKYNLPNALESVMPFLDDASNWYVRRSRRRFWKSEDDEDKQMAYTTLHYVLVRLAYVLAPFTPFLAEELYYKLTGDKESIHLKDWPSSGKINELVMNDMELVRNYVNQGLGMRARASIKVRQPLACVTVPSLGNAIDFEPILKDELNVKNIKISKSPVKLNKTETELFGVESANVYINTKITPELKREGLMRELIRAIQATRKEAGLSVDDRIALSIKTKDEQIQTAIKDYTGTIKAETLAVVIKEDPVNAFKISKKIEGSDVQISLKKQKA